MWNVHAYKPFLNHKVWSTKEQETDLISACKLCYWVTLYASTASSLPTVGETDSLASMYTGGYAHANVNCALQPWHPMRRRYEGELSYPSLSLFFYVAASAHGCIYRIQCCTAPLDLSTKTRMLF